jgi:hypothetical protein
MHFGWAGKMSKKTPQTSSDLERHLAEHLGFLENSARAFDNGFTDEAKRLAVSLRVLLHNSKHSHSLLNQLGKLSISFYDTALPIDQTNPLSQASLVSTVIGKGIVEPIAHLDEPPEPPRMTPYGRWWNAPVILDTKRRAFSRRDLVLYLANQDGGAHVDPALDSVYSELSRGNAIGWSVMFEGGLLPVEGIERVSVRQIAHETLKTLNPHYQVQRELPNDVWIVGGMKIETGPTDNT